MITVFSRTIAGRYSAIVLVVVLVLYRLEDGSNGLLYLLGHCFFRLGRRLSFFFLLLRAGVLNVYDHRAIVFAQQSATWREHRGRSVHECVPWIGACWAATIATRQVEQRSYAKNRLAIAFRV